MYFWIEPSLIIRYDTTRIVNLTLPNVEVTRKGGCGAKYVGKVDKDW